MKSRVWRTSAGCRDGCSIFTFSSRVPQHGVGHHHNGPPENVGQHEDVELLQALVDGLVRRLHPEDNHTARKRVQNGPSGSALRLCEERAVPDGAAGAVVDPGLAGAELEQLVPLLLPLLLRVHQPRLRRRRAHTHGNVHGSHRDGEGNEGQVFLHLPGIYFSVRPKAELPPERSLWAWLWEQELLPPRCHYPPHSPSPLLPQQQLVECVFNCQI